MVINSFEPRTKWVCKPSNLKQDLETLFSALFGLLLTCKNYAVFLWPNTIVIPASTGPLAYVFKTSVVNFE